MTEIAGEIRTFIYNLQTELDKQFEVIEALSNKVETLETETDNLKDRSEKEQLAQIFEIANNAIYFQDSSDYLTVLYAICKIIKPGNETIGDVFINESKKTQ